MEASPAPAISHDISQQKHETSVVGWKVGFSIVLVLFVAAVIGIVLMMTVFKVKCQPPVACNSCCPGEKAKCAIDHPDGHYKHTIQSVPGVKLGHLSFSLASADVDFHFHDKVLDFEIDIKAIGFTVKPVIEKGIPYTFDTSTCAITLDDDSPGMKDVKDTYGAVLSNLTYNADTDQVVGSITISTPADFPSKNSGVSINTGQMTVPLNYVANSAPPKPQGGGTKSRVPSPQTSACPSCHDAGCSWKVQRSMLKIPACCSDAGCDAMCDNGTCCKR